MSHLYFIKDNDRLISHCACGRALVTFPPQMDCPWCGCGWLFTCIDCRKAFTFARAIEVEEDWESLAKRDLFNRRQSAPSSDEVRDWITAMQGYAKGAQSGKQYVAFDGRFIPTDQRSIDFDGWHSTHKLDFIPQIAALTDVSIIENILSNEEYWKSHALDSFTPSLLGKPAIRDRKSRWRWFR